MISDTLADAVILIDQQLKDDFYRGRIRREIEKCRTHIERVRRILDTPPTAVELKHAGRGRGRLTMKFA